jgi:hypothetical protein
MLSDQPYFHDDHFGDKLTEAINFDLFEPWREIDARITSFCPCSLTPSGACSPKQRSRAKRSRSRSCRRAERGKSTDPDGDPSPGNPDLLNSRRTP